MTDFENLEKYIETDIATIGMRTDGIVHIFYKMGVEVDQQALRIMMESINSFLPDGEYPFLVEADDFVSFQEEGRKYMVEIENKLPSTKNALVLDNIGYQLIVKHFIANDKPKKDYNVFQDFDQATKWLLS